MSDFFDEYLNVKKMMQSKRAYKEQMARVAALPEDYQFVFQKVQGRIWMFATGSGDNIMKIQADFIERLERGAAEKKPVLQVTGKDVADFCDKLLQSANIDTEDWRDVLNREIREKLHCQPDQPL